MTLKVALFTTGRASGGRAVVGAARTAVIAPMFAAVIAVVVAALGAPAAVATGQDGSGGTIGAAPLWGTLDAMVRTGTTAWSGADVVGPRQLVTLQLARRSAGTAYVRVCNQNGAQAVRLRGTAGDAAFGVRYAIGGRDVTSAIVHGTYRTGRLASGSCTARVKVTVSRKPGVVAGAHRLVTLRAVPAVGYGDQVSVRARAS